MPRHKLEDIDDEDEDRGKKLAALVTTAGLLIASAGGATALGDDDTMDVSLDQRVETVATQKVEREIPSHLPTVEPLALNREAAVPKATPAKTSTTSTVKASSPSTPKTTATAVVSASWRDRAIGEAKKHIGIPYVWGGNSPSQGFDCSGYTRWVYRKVGISIPRVANDQMRAMKRTTNPKPGDLVFFLNGSGYAYHVGIYAGAGYMYAAPRKGLNVRKERIWSGRVVYRTPK